jgi:UDP-N-acetylmuramoyl-L-alanyl-D-glutamate--2,6-diaminopimelate ligase
VKLKDLLKKYVTIVEDIEISGIECDSRKVKQDDLFLAYPGDGSDGRKFIDNVVNKGAVAVLAEKKGSNINNCSIPIFYMDDLKKYIGGIAAEFYNFPSKNIQIIGVTGTNGKTSTCFYIAEMLNGLGIKTAVIGTTGYGLPDNLTELENTTPGSVEQQKIFAELRSDDIEAVAMEVSSHALAQGRVADVEIDAAVYTNLSQDHLDYHNDMEDYANAKKMIFFIPSVKYVSLNVDDVYGHKWFKELSFLKHKLISYSTNKNLMGTDFVCADNIKLDMRGMEFEICTPSDQNFISIDLLGHFNVSNITAAVSILYLLGYDFTKITEQCKKLKAVPGRMQVCRSDNSKYPIAVVDYSHTPDALKNALSALKAQCRGRLICVFGCGGNRDRKKRPLMAQAVEKYSDIIVVTNDNPRYEDQFVIIDDIKKGFKNLDDITFEADRKKAIEQAIQKGNSDDIVLIAGKGHEDYQIIDGIKHHFSDVEVVEDFFQNKL